MPENNEFLVKAVAYRTSPLRVTQWDGYSDERKVIGYLPMIFGTSWFGGYSVLCSAVDHVDVARKDPSVLDLYESEEEAMNAWETGEPVKMPETVASKNKLRSEAQNRITELGLYRKAK